MLFWSMGKVIRMEKAAFMSYGFDTNCTIIIVRKFIK